MSFIDNNLMRNEAVIYRVRLHWSVFLTALFTFVLAIYATFQQLRQFDGILYLVTVFLIIVALVRYLSSEFVLTNERIIVKLGVLNRTSYEMLLNKIEGIEVEQSLLGRLLGYGTLIVRGVGGSREVFYKIEKPLIFRRYVQEQIAIIPNTSAA